VQQCLNHGATWAFNYKTEDWAESVKSSAKPLGVHIILDCVGCAATCCCLQDCLPSHCTHVVSLRVCLNADVVVLASACQALLHAAPMVAHAAQSAVPGEEYRLPRA